MNQITGRVSELGDGVNTITGSGASFTTYSYIEVNGTPIRKVKVLGGLETKLRGAVGLDEVTLFMSSDFLVGIKMPDRKTYSSAFPMPLFMKVFCYAIGLLGVVTIPFGLIILYFDHKLWKQVRAADEARKVPNAIVL